MYNILIADDHPLFREAIQNVLASGFPGCQLSETGDLEHTLAHACGDDSLDLILLDLNMPGMQGLAGLVALRNAAPTVPVVVLSAEQDKHVVLQAITCGAVGFISKSAPRQQIIAALNHVLEGNVYLPPDIIRGPTAAHTGNPATPNELLRALTRKQLQVLERMALGESNKMIAYHLNIAETTVKAHVSAILRKMGVHNRVQAILNAREVDFSQWLA